MENDSADQKHEDRRGAQKDRGQRQREGLHRDVIADHQDQRSEDCNGEDERKVPQSYVEKGAGAGLPLPVLDQDINERQQSADGSPRKYDGGIVESRFCKYPHENTGQSPAGAGNDRQKYEQVDAVVVWLIVHDGYCSRLGAGCRERGDDTLWERIPTDIRKTTPRNLRNSGSSGVVSFVSLG